jgi:hypothetical protein
VDRGTTGSHSALVSVEVRRDGDRSLLVLREPDDELAVPLGAGDWAVSEPVGRQGHVVPVAASGGWTDADTLRAAVVFLETPHRLDVALSLTDRTASAVWPHPPLGRDRLDALRSP